MEFVDLHPRFQKGMSQTRADASQAYHRNLGVQLQGEGAWGLTLALTLCKNLSGRRNAHPHVMFSPGGRMTGVLGFGQSALSVLRAVGLALLGPSTDGG